MSTVRYPAYLYRCKDGSIDVMFPDLPGCVSGGDTPDQALVNAEEGLGLHIDGMAEDGDEIPPPSPLGCPVPDWANEPEVVALVPVDIPGKAVRVTISMDGKLLAKVDRTAKGRGMTRSGFLAEGARTLLGSVR